jgi:hypothetical protein
MTNGEGGLVLTKMLNFSPARMLVCETYPSIHGQRYLVGGSTRVFSSNQEVVPGFSFSWRMRSRCCSAKPICPPRSPATLTAVCCNISRRVGCLAWVMSILRVIFAIK